MTPPFEKPWDPTTPAGTAPANTVATELRNLEFAIQERLESVFGISDWDTQTDPINIGRLLMKAIAASYIVGGSTSWAVRNNAESANNLLVEDDGDVTIRKDLSILGKIVAALVLEHNFTQNAGFLSTFKSRVSVEDAQGGIKRKDLGSVNGSLAIDWNAGNNQALTLTGNISFTFSNPQPGSWYTLEIKQDGTGSRTVTDWSAAVIWPESAPPVLTAVGGRTDLFAFYWNGTGYLAGMIGPNYNV